jgi:hypothetical protein
MSEATSGIEAPHIAALMRATLAESLGIVRSVKPTRVKG